MDVEGLNLKLSGAERNGYQSVNPVKHSWKLLADWEWFCHFHKLFYRLIIGIVASGVVQALAKQGEHNKITHLVFLDAMVPTPQKATIKSLFTVKNPPAWLQPWLKENFSIGKLVRSTPLPPPPLRLMGFTDETSVQARWVADHMTP